MSNLYNYSSSYTNYLSVGNRTLYPAVTSRGTSPEAESVSIFNYSDISFSAILESNQ